VKERSDDIFGCRVGPAAREEAYVFLDEHCEVCFSEDGDAPGRWECHLLHLLRNDEGQGIDNFALLVSMIGRGIAKRSHTVEESGLA
jgi:hypothetical protein